MRTRVAEITCPIVCLITDRGLVGDRSLATVVAEAVAGGVTMVQLREKDLPTRELLDLATRLREIVRPPAVFLVNGRADIARSVGADGVHLPADGLPIVGAHRSVGPAALVGRSAHAAPEVERAVADGADYVELGTVFPSRSHPGGTTIGTEGLRAVVGIPVPLLAVGGIDADNADAVIAAGADGVAVISAILAAREPGLAAERLAAVVRRASDRRNMPATQAALSATSLAAGQAHQGAAGGQAGVSVCN